MNEMKHNKLIFKEYIGAIWFSEIPLTWPKLESTPMEAAAAAVASMLAGATVAGAGTGVGSSPALSLRCPWHEAEKSEREQFLPNFCTNNCVPPTVRQPK